MATPRYKNGYCVSCQKPVSDRYYHKKKFPSHILEGKKTHQNAGNSAVEEEILDASGQIDSKAAMGNAADDQAGAEAKKISGAEFASQPIFVAAGGVGLGWLTAKVFGPQNALKQEEAYGIAAGVLRLIGRHFLANIEMKELTQANNDVNDLLLIGRAIASYVGRLWKTSDEQDAMQQAGPSQPRQQPEPIRQRAQTAQNGHVPVEAEAAFVQDQYTAALFNMPSMGEAA